MGGQPGTMSESHHNKIAVRQRFRPNHPKEPGEGFAGPLERR
ncbi:hypothetical protein [Actinomadura sp. KC216]|nr:hypothetical protein [Actinomadura sp. KC216]